MQFYVYKLLPYGTLKVLHTVPILQMDVTSHPRGGPEQFPFDFTRYFIYRTVGLAGSLLSELFVFFLHHSTTTPFTCCYRGSSSFVFCMATNTLIVFNSTYILSTQYVHSTYFKNILYEVIILRMKTTCLKGNQKCMGIWSSSLMQSFKYSWF